MLATGLRAASPWMMKFLYFESSFQTRRECRFVDGRFVFKPLLSQPGKPTARLAHISIRTLPLSHSLASMDDAFIARVLQRVAAAGPLRSFEHERASAIALWGATIAHHADRSAPVPAATTNGSPLAVATQHSSSSTGTLFFSASAATIFTP